MLSPGRIPMSAAENERLDELLEQRGADGVTITRRDPGDTGPLVVAFPDGETVELDDDEEG